MSSAELQDGMRECWCSLSFLGSGPGSTSSMILPHHLDPKDLAGSGRRNLTAHVRTEYYVAKTALELIMH